MKLRCIIVEDEPLARNLITDYVSKVPYLELVEACSNPMRAMEVLKENQVDLMFLDIQMPEITGLTLLKVLQQKPLVILTTAYSQYALESYDLDVVDYLLKPITFDRFLKAVEKANQRHNKKDHAVPVTASSSPPDFVFIKDGSKMIKVRYNDILYIEGLKDYVTIHTSTQKIVSLQRLKTLEEELPRARFVRIHNSYIVNLSAIDVIHKNDVQIGQAHLPISDSYKKTFKEFIERNHLARG